MQNSKKFTKITLAILLATSALTACNSEKQQTNTQTNPVTSETTTKIEQGSPSLISEFQNRLDIYKEVLSVFYLKMHSLYIRPYSYWLDILNGTYSLYLYKE